MKKTWKIGFILGLVVMFILLTGCATMFRTNQVTVSAASGANANVQVLENGVSIFTGTLPAQFPVKGGRTYTVHFTLENGEDRIVTIGQSFNGWFIGSILLGLLPAIVDLATGNVMTYEKSAVLPISYSPMIILGENIPHNDDFRTIGNFLYGENNDVFNCFEDSNLIALGM